MENLNSIIETLQKHKSELVDKYGLSRRIRANPPH